jgi:putative membrane protein (TIGR04086 family)
MSAFTGIRWGWVLLGGFLAELAIFILVIPLALWLGNDSMAYSAPPASFVTTFLLGLLMARKAGSRFLLHGTLVGVVAMLLYVAVSLGQPVPWLYIVAHMLKVLGGMAGGFVAGKQTRTTVASDVAGAA